VQDWGRDGFAGPRSGDFAAMNTLPSYRKSSIGWGTVQRVRCEDLSPEDFVREFEGTNRPVVISGVPEVEGWAADERWDLSNLLSNEKLSEYAFKCGEDDDGRSVRVRLKHFAR
jgi:hypothetical protein